MAMINCPDCKNKVSDTAISCPHCGYILKETDQKKNKADKEVVILLKRKLATYYLDIILIFLSWCLSFLAIKNLKALYGTIPLGIICTLWCLSSIIKIRKNNRIAKECVYFDKANKTVDAYDLKGKSHLFALSNIVKIRKDNLFSDSLYLYCKEVDNATNTQKISKINVGYATKDDITKFKNKVKDLMDVDTLVG